MAAQCGLGEFSTINGDIATIKDLDLGDTLPEQPFELNIGRFRLVGKLGNRYRKGLLFYRVNVLKGKDFINAWLQHLISNQLQTNTTWLLTCDEAIQFNPEHGQTSDLAAWLDIYHSGQNRPDAFFVEAALAYVKAQGGKTPPLAKANHTLLATIEKSYEPAMKQLFWHKGRQMPCGLEHALGKSFAKQCDELLLPIWQATH